MTGRHLDRRLVVVLAAVMLISMRAWGERPRTALDQLRVAIADALRHEAEADTGDRIFAKELLACYMQDAIADDPRSLSVIRKAIRDSRARESIIHQAFRRALRRSRSTPALLAWLEDVLRDETMPFCARMDGASSLGDTLCEVGSGARRWVSLLDDNGMQPVLRGMLWNGGAAGGSRPDDALLDLAMRILESPAPAELTSQVLGSMTRWLDSDTSGRVRAFLRQFPLPPAGGGWLGVNTLMVDDLWFEGDEHIGSRVLAWFRTQLSRENQALHLGQVSEQVLDRFEESRVVSAETFRRASLVLRLAEALPISERCPQEIANQTRRNLLQLRSVLEFQDTLQRMGFEVSTRQW